MYVFTFVGTNSVLLVFYNSDIVTHNLIFIISAFEITDKKQNIISWTFSERVHLRTKEEKSRKWDWQTAYQCCRETSIVWRITKQDFSDLSCVRLLNQSLYDPLSNTWEIFHTCWWYVFLVVNVKYYFCIERPIYIHTKTRCICY